MKYDIQIKIKYAPLPTEREPAWEDAMRILFQWMSEMDQEDKKKKPQGVQTHTALKNNQTARNRPFNSYDSRDL